jgi:hypothetical protein
MVKYKVPKSKISTTSYVIRSPFIADVKELSISEDEFASIKVARNFLLQYMQFEEGVLYLKFAIADFETFLLDVSVQEHIFPEVEFNAFQNLRLRSNLRTVAFLNAVASFKDQFPDFSKYYSCKLTRREFISRWDQLRQDSLAFSFCERLRNYAQHQNQPVRYVTTGGGWDSNRVHLEMHASVFASVPSICENRSIDSIERQKYTSSYGDKADISLILRETVGKIGELSNLIRSDLNYEFQTSSDIIDALLVRLQSEFTSHMHGDVVRLDNGMEAEIISIFPDFIHRAKQLRNSRFVTGNEHHYVSNRARGHSGPRTPSP